MSKDRQETIADIIEGKRREAQHIRENNDTLLGRGEALKLEEEADRIEAAWKREKRKFEFALDIQKNLVAKLCELLKEFEDVLNDTKNYACFGCTIRGCPGEHECRYTKKYCLLVDKARKAIEDVKGTQHIELTKKET